MDDNIANFTAITSAEPERAAQYLRLTDNNLEQAIQLFFDSPNLDVGNGSTSQAASSTSHPPQPSSAPTSRARPPVNYPEDPIQIDSDDDMSDFDTGADYAAAAIPAAAPSSQQPSDALYEDDEAMARRLQEELYAGGDSAGAAGNVRAPMARTTETLVGPGPTWGSDPEDLNALVSDQIAARTRRPAGRPGIFNQRPIQSSVWDNDSSDPNARRRDLSMATAGASDSSQKSNLLAEMYRPPFELMSQLSWDKARDEGKEAEKWIIVNIQDPAIFDCQVLNRDIWKNPQIKETVKENFIFMQYSKDDPRGNKYIQYYFQARDSQDAYPHIAIVDPRTGERVKVWSGHPVPKPMDFLMQLHEFLDRYSLKANARNPVATRKPERKKVDVNRMTEEEMLQMAMQNSLDNNKGPRDDDPDALTKEPEVKGKGKGKVVEEDSTGTSSVEHATTTNGSDNSPFSQISALSPHTEPPNSPATTRIQFRTPDGKRQVRRFALSDPVRRIFEWLKASPAEGKEGVEFELIFMGKKLIDVLDLSIQDAGLKNGSVNVEFLDESDD
ncbi:hypothetical protein AOQ84DRAFT_365976 [Glonium stellatum]|uniref:UBX domain-containing protein n=1 Tax=Glonium stellatum TaxID=574774 RepID=A0A8E2EWV4_9PEZI|nr:hypothetical protein AOQ84DRAFT_365976 [Glonium stellatum]